MFERCLGTWEILYSQWCQFSQLCEYLSSLGCRSRDDRQNEPPWGSQSIFIKGHGGTNTENISKREVNCQMCSTPVILATAASALPWTLLHESWNLSRFHSCIFCCQRNLLPLIQEWFPFLCIRSLRAINSPLHFRGEGGYRNHPLFDRLPGCVQPEKVSPLCKSLWAKHFLCLPSSMPPAKFHYWTISCPLCEG